MYESSLFLEFNVATSTSNKKPAQDKSLLHRDGFHKSEQLFRETSFRSWCQSLHIIDNYAKKNNFYKFRIDYYERKKREREKQQQFSTQNNVDCDDDDDDDRGLIMLMYDLKQTRTIPRSNSMMF